MPGEELNTAAGGLHPGRPVIWPTGKGSPQVQQSQVAQTTGGVRGVPNKATPEKPGEAQSTSAATTTTKAVQAQAQEPIARPLSQADIKAHLLSLQIPDTSFNVKLANLMLKSSIELSRSNFIRLLTMMDGTSKSLNVQEAALALLMKGIDSPEALKILSNYFEQNPQLAHQILAMQEAMANLQTALGVSGKVLDAILIAQIGALVSQFDGFLKELTSKYKFTGDSSINREELASSLRAMKSLLEGIQEKAMAKQGAASEVLTSNLQEGINKLNGALENLIAQAVMSKGSDRTNVNYQYYQVPNAEATPPKNMEIIVKRDGNGSNAIIDPNNTQVIMSLETENLGKVSIIMKIKEKKVGFLFNTQNEEARNLIIKQSGELKNKLFDRDYITEGFQAKVNPSMCTMKPYLIPLIGLEDLLRINLEA